MNIILLLTSRYIRGSRALGFLSMKSRISFTVMAVGVALLIVVLSIFNGFQRQVKESLWQGGAHVTIENNYGTGKIVKYQKLIEIIRKDKELGDRIVSINGNITSHALLQNYSSFIPIMIRALPVGDSNNTEVDLKEFPRLTHFDRSEISDIGKGKYAIVGKEMVPLYSLTLGKQLRIAVPSGRFRVGTGVEVNVDTFRVSGYFKTGYYNFDSSFVFMSLPMAQRLFQLHDAVNQISIRVKRLDDLELVRKRLMQVLGSPEVEKNFEEGFSVRTIAEEQENFLTALKLEKTIMSVIVFLFIVLAALGMVASVYSLVRSKRKSIGTLKALGLTSSRILLIFTLNSMLIGVLASLAGGVAGIFLASNIEHILNIVGETINAFGGIIYQSEWRHVELVPRDVYYFDHIPVDIDISFIFMVTTASTILSGLAGYFPARWASQLNPVDTIRND